MNKYQEALDRIEQASQFYDPLLARERRIFVEEIKLLQELVNKTNGLEYGNPITHENQTDYYCGKCGAWLGTIIQGDK